MNNSVLNFITDNIIWILPLIIIIEVFDLVFRGIALWRSAQNKHTAWFVLLLIINSVGILPIIYLILNPKKQI